MKIRKDLWFAATISALATGCSQTPQPAPTSTITVITSTTQAPAPAPAPPPSPTPGRGATPTAPRTPGVPGADGSTGNDLSPHYCARNEDPGCPAGTYVGPDAIPNPNGDGSFVPCEGTICTNPDHGAGPDPGDPSDPAAPGDGIPEPGQDMESP
ncbi:hypothetical protein OKHIL_76720 [Mycolicibacterium mageritense]|nr:hypothetical protein MTY414_77410 [Mycolicibacterium mageritense]